jgi:hypothetical protein
MTHAGFARKSMLVPPVQVILTLFCTSRRPLVT